MTLDAIQYELDGRSFAGFFADGSDDGPAPGLLVVHEGPGLGEHTKERARMLAELGYVGLATLYALIYAAALLALGLVVFRQKDV